MTQRPTTRDFLKAKPEHKAEMVTDGILRMAHDINALAVNMGVLNAWLNSMPALVHKKYAQLPEVKKLRKTYEAFARAHDQFTYELVVASQNIEALTPLYEAKPQSHE